MNGPVESLVSPWLNSPPGSSPIRGASFSPAVDMFCGRVQKHEIIWMRSQNVSKPYPFRHRKVQAGIWFFPFDRSETSTGFPERVETWR